jgi:hypothetical protein
VSPASIEQAPPAPVDLAESEPVDQARSAPIDQAAPVPVGSIDPAGGGDREPLESLRQILVGRENARLDVVEARLSSIEHHVGDDEALATAITPLMTTAIRRQIQDARAEMVEALYPIIGALIGRAVAESMRDLARQVDARMRQGVDPRLWWWRLRARLGGVPEDALSLRAFLPFRVAEVFAIRRESGLLLAHASRQPQAEADSAIIGSMLTAIRDFAGDVLAARDESELDEIQYGQQHILIETGRLMYLAVVTEGVEPPGFRAELREHVHAIEQDRRAALQVDTVDASDWEPVQPRLRAILDTGQPRPLNRPQKLLLVGLVLGILAAIVVLSGTCFLLWRALRPVPPPAPAPAPAIVVVVTATPGPTTPPTPARLGAISGHVWAHEGPAGETPRMRVVRSGQVVEILDASGGWLLVRWTSGVGGELRGWVPADLVQPSRAAPTEPVP